MKEFSKKISLCFMVLLGVLVMNLMVPEVVWAVDSDFVIDENGVLVEYVGSNSDVVIPEGVIKIGNEAFWSYTNLTDITIPNSVIDIGYHAFFNCYNLKSIIISDSVININNEAFTWCSNLKNINVSNLNSNYKDENGVLFSKDGTRLITYPNGKDDTSYIIPEGVVNIGNNAFDDCSSLTNIIIPNSVISISNKAFNRCEGLASIAIPNSVTSIENNPFTWCSNLKNINVSNLNSNYKDENGVLFSKDGTRLIAYPDGKNNINYIIPNHVVDISNNAFDSCASLTNITIPDSVTSIGDSAFYNCHNLISITIPDSVTSIGDSAFKYCTNLLNIEIPNSVTSISNNVFENCYRLKNVIIPNSVTSIGEMAFSSCASLTNITIPDSVISIGGYVFNYCSKLTNVVLADKMTYIPSSTFSNCSNLTSITIPESVTDIHYAAFNFCDKLESIFIYNDSVNIDDSIGTLGNKDITTLYGNKNSNTEAYANKYGYQFKELEDQNKPLINISLAKTNITLKVGKSTLNSVIYNPTDTTDDKTVKWSSSNSSVARVLTNGKIQALSKGIAVITATVGDKTATCNVTVTE